MIRPSSAGEIHRAIVAFADSGRAFAAAIVLRDEGSTPRKAATKALIEPNGSIRGTIGGGKVEAETQRLAIEAIRTGRPVAFDFVLEGGSAEDDQPICGGSMRILIDPTAAAHAAAYAKAAEAERLRRRGVLLTSVRTSALQPSGTHVGPAPKVAVLWIAEGAVPADMGFPGSDAVRAALARQTPEFLVQDEPQAGAQLQVLVEPLIPPPLLVIAGGGHIGQALALQAGLVGFAVTVLDDRPEFTDPALYPAGVVTRRCDIAGELAGFPIAADTFIAIVTRGHQHDRAALAACIRKPAAYIGMIGSRRKVALIRKDLVESGDATEEEFNRVYAPIGLDIGAETVPEIAASIVAQLIAVCRKGVAPRFPAAQVHA
ncbi:MAG: XdhC family protein [Candidatus Brocadiia bacterium]|jgi:xanthine dehydrogenase accessory factor